MSNMSTMFMIFTCVLVACNMASGQQDDYYESFEDGVPAHFAATRADSLSITPWHSKEGNNSLRWDWAKGEDLVIHHGIGDLTRVGGHGCRTSFAVWVYMEEPISDALVFEFREGEEVTGSFRFPLEFTGWRQGRPFYSQFPDGKPTSEVDNIRIAAPSQVAKGTVFLDFIKYNTLTIGGRALIPEKEAQWQRPVPDEQRFPKPERVTEAELAGIRSLLGPDEGPGIEEAKVQELCDKVKALGIVRDEHGVRGGPGIDRHYQYCCKVGEHGAKRIAYWPDEHGPGWLGMETPSAISVLAYQVASAYRSANDADQRRRLAEAFLLIEDYLYDQGMQAGAGFHWNWWIGGNYANAMFLMRDVLADAERLARQRDYLLWNYGGGAIFADADPPSHMDYYHLYVSPLLRACLVQVEPTEQVRWLNGLKAMLERSMLQPTSAFKIDGSAYHHSGHYFAYARNAFGTLPPLLQQLGDTPWRLSGEAHGRLRRAMLAQRIYCNQLDLPLSLSGRRPFGSDFYSKNVDRISPQALDVLARCGTPDGKQQVDPQVAAAYLRLAPEAVNEEPYSTLGIKPEPDPNGTFVMPYAALLSHRRDDWLASVHGQSKYIWGSERQANENCFGLFQGIGHLEILAGGTPVSAKASGRDGHGWDWRRHEGTTVPQLPLETIDKGWTSTRSAETFVGGLSHQGQQGIFAMIVNQPMPDKKTLAGRKSWFFNDNQILCLGSNISCDEAEYPTQTTLCQKRLPENEQGEFVATPLDATDFTAFPEERTLDEASPHWFLDVQQTGYYLPTGQNVAVARRHQKNRDYENLNDTEGDFLTAWIDHGKAPEDASYEYMLVVRATPETMQQLAADQPYRIIQRDQDAHIIWHTGAGRWSCVFFVPQEVTPQTVDTEALQIKAVDRPCLIMAEAVQDGQLAVSIADPDLNLEKGVNKPQPLRVTLRGAWRLLEATGTVCAWQLPDAGANVRLVSADGDETVLEILCEHGASYDIKLAR
jgi:chondroitin-sulfate-ABC endolyase/exolyase